MLSVLAENEAADAIPPQATMGQLDLQRKNRSLTIMISDQPCPVDEEGFAAVDALVALIILSVTIILSLAAAQTARRAAATALETRGARQTLASLLEITPHGIGEVEGRSAAFSWRVTTAPSPTDVRWPTSQICIRSAMIQAIASRRDYQMSTAEICPAPRPSS